MKVSSSVARWKSFVDKLHPQVPLTGQESQRLLTALTSSFRKHLDEAHPTSPVEQERKARPAEVRVAKPQNRTWHSSASYADKHLASVLTNPLFVKSGRKLDYASAKIALAEDSSKDPIELLEEYQQQNAATVPIATLCLQTVMNRSKLLTPEQRLKLIQDIEPGRRTFLWLLQSDFLNTDHYADNLYFQELLVYFLLREGREHNIWEWIKLDAPIADSTVSETPGRDIGTPMVEKSFKSYRWRGRILHALVTAKLGQTVRDRRDGKGSDWAEVHAALDAYFQACEIKRLAPRGSHLQEIPLMPALAVLQRVLGRGNFAVKKGLDPDKMDKLLSYLPFAHKAEGSDRTWARFKAAQLHLVHPRPRRLQADPAFQLLQDLLGHEGAAGKDDFLQYLTSPPSLAAATSWSSFIARTIRILQIQRRDEDAAWVESTVKSQLPNLVPEMDRILREISRDNQVVRRVVKREYGNLESPIASLT